MVSEERENPSIFNNFYKFFKHRGHISVYSEIPRLLFPRERPDVSMNILFAEGTAARHIECITQHRG